MTIDTEIYNSVLSKNKKDFILAISKVEKRNELLKIVINAFCSYCVSDNLYVMSKFYKHLVDYQNNKNKQDIIIKSLCNTLFHKYNVITFDDHLIKRILHDYDVPAMMHRKQISFSHLDEFRQIFNEDLVNCLDILWEIITKGWGHQRFDACLAICLFIKSIPKKSIFKKDILITGSNGLNKLDYYDILFNFVMAMLNAYSFYENVIKHIKICRTLFYYQCRAKDKHLREPLLYVCLRALLKRSVDNERLSEPSEERENTLEALQKSPWGYLNALTTVNNELIDQVNYEKSKCQKHPKKEIDIGEVGYLNIEGRRQSVVVQKN